MYETYPYVIYVAPSGPGQLHMNGNSSAWPLFHYTGPQPRRRQIKVALVNSIVALPRFSPRLLGYLLQHVSESVTFGRLRWDRRRLRTLLPGMSEKSILGSQSEFHQSEILFLDFVS